MTENAATTNQMTTSSGTTPPIRIGQPLSSSSPIAVAQGQQQQQQQQQQQPLSLLQHQSNSMGATSGSDSPGAAGGAGSSGSGSAAQQHSSSAPNTATSSGYQMQLQSGGGGSPLPPAGSNQSLAIGAISSSITPPNSAGLRQSGGLANWANDSRDKYDGNQTDKTPEASKLNRKESYKAQRKNYRREKKRVASELLNSLQDPAVVVLADWLKVRGTLKSWTKLWCVLKPGLLLIYKSPKTKSSHWVGTILLTSCQVIERPSKKDGFCFKLFHPLEQSIWAPRGPDKETIGAVVQPLPTAYLIFRAPSQAAGKCWMDALELSLRCSALLLRSNSNSGAVQSAAITDPGQMSHETQWSEADYEKHFNEHEGAAKAPKRYAQYLSAGDAECGKSPHTNTEYSLPSRSQTPLFQQLYLSMTNWERIGPEFQRFKRLPKTLRDYRGSRSSVADLSDASSVADGASRFVKDSAMTMPLSLKLKRRRQKQFTKSASLGSLTRRCPVGVAITTSSTSSSFSSPAKSKRPAGIRAKAPRPLSAPPMIINVTVPSAESNLDVDSQNEGATAVLSGGDTESDSDVNDGPEVASQDLPETPYIPMVEEEFGTVGEQVEELAEENKSLIWCLVKQVRPGMDLSKVVLPTFILEPRSFLDKLSDSYYHADILSRAVQEDDPFTRMKLVVQWYLSGFYKKPKGLKKPYNPILGETFRCYWQHENGSRTYYIAEQVSHHPPISAFYVTNRQDGFCISCSILAKSKFYGNSTSAVLEGVATLTLLPRGESYTLTTPYAHCKGILMGTLSMELGGKISIECENTGYKTELEFKLKPFLGGSDSTNVVAGKIRLGKETLATISGHWDTEMRIKDSKTHEESVLLSVDAAIKQKRLTRYMVPLDAQLANESERLWQLVSAAIARDDQVGATEEKTVLEEAQRRGAKERAAMLADWTPLHFQQDLNTGQWIYKYADLRPWDPRNDVKQFETDYKVLTKTRHQAPMVRTASMISGMRADVQQSAGRKVARKSKQVVAAIRSEYPLDSSGTDDEGKLVPSKEIRRLTVALDQVNKALEDHKRQLALIQSKLERIQYAPPASSSFQSIQSGSGMRLILPDSLPQSVVTKSIICAFIGVFVCLCLKWFAK